MTNTGQIEDDIENVPDSSDADAEHRDLADVEDSDLQAEIESLLAQLEEERSRTASHKDTLMRTLAEMENLRKRNQRDLENAHKYALEKFASEIVSVKDSLELGLSAAQGDDAQVQKLREGTELTLKMFAQVLNKFNIVELDPAGTPFNPEHHQAMSMQESADTPPNTVVNVMQKGYLLNKRLLRPALVIVSKKPN